MQIVQYKTKKKTILWDKNEKVYSDGVNIYRDIDLKVFLVGLNSLNTDPSELLEAKKRHDYSPVVLRHYIDNIHVVSHLNHAMDIVRAMMSANPVTPNQMVNVMLKTAFVFYYANRFSAGDLLVYNSMEDENMRINKLVKYDYDNNNIRLVFDSGHKIELSSISNIRVANQDEKARYNSTMKSIGEN